MKAPLDRVRHRRGIRARGFEIVRRLATSPATRPSSTNTTREAVTAGKSGAMSPKSAFCYAEYAWLGKPRKRAIPPDRGAPPQRRGLRSSERDRSRPGRGPASSPRDADPSALSYISPKRKGPRCERRQHPAASCGTPPRATIAIPSSRSTSRPNRRRKSACTFLLCVRHASAFRLPKRSCSSCSMRQETPSTVCRHCGMTMHWLAGLPGGRRPPVVFGCRELHHRHQYQRNRRRRLALDLTRILDGWRYSVSPPSATNTAPVV